MYISLYSSLKLLLCDQDTITIFKTTKMETNNFDQIKDGIPTLLHKNGSY